MCSACDILGASLSPSLAWCEGFTEDFCRSQAAVTTINDTLEELREAEEELLEDAA